MALLNIAFTDPWMSEYDACEKLFREIMEQITTRNEYAKASQAYANLSANIRLRLKQYSREVQELRMQVETATRELTITSDEAEWRIRQIELLESKDVQLQKLYGKRTNDSAGVRANLMRSGGSAFADAGTTSWAADDDDSTSASAQASVNDLVNQQDRILEEQDKGLEELRKVIVRQKEIGQAISNEVDHQNEIIDSLADHMDRTDSSLVNKTRQIRSISAKDRTCWYWVAIILLFIVILAVALV